jgi:hypothetical protein
MGAPLTARFNRNFRAQEIDGELRRPPREGVRSARRGSFGDAPAFCADRTRAPRFADLLELSLAEQAALDGFDRRSPNGRPLGAPDFIAMVEELLGRRVQPRRRGRKPRGERQG